MKILEICKKKPDKSSNFCFTMLYKENNYLPWFEYALKAKIITKKDAQSAKIFLFKIEYLFVSLG